MANFAYANFKIGENLYASFSFTGDYYKYPGEWFTDETGITRVALGAAELTIRGYGDTYDYIPEAYDYYYEEVSSGYAGTQYWNTCINFFWNWNEGGTLAFPDGMTSICYEFLPRCGIRYTEFNEWGYQDFENIYLDKIVLPDSFERITYPVSGAKHVVGSNIRYVGLGADGSEYGAFNGHDYLESITLRNDCYITDYAFSGCLKLNKINDSNSLGGRVGTQSFCDCISLTSLNILESLIIDTSGIWGSPNYSVFWITDQYEPVVTVVTGEQSIILAYNWEQDRRILSTEIQYKYTLLFENHNNEWIRIPLKKDSSGQVKINCDANLLSCHLTDDLITKYTGLVIAVDGKWYQFKE